MQNTAFIKLEWLSTLNTVLCSRMVVASSKCKHSLCDVYRQITLPLTPSSLHLYFQPSSPSIIDLPQRHANIPFSPMIKNQQRTRHPLTRARYHAFVIACCDHVVLRHTRTKHAMHARIYSVYYVANGCDVRVTSTVWSLVALALSSAML